MTRRQARGRNRSQLPASQLTRNERGEAIDNAMWIKNALGGKSQSDRYGNRMYRKECECRGEVKFTPHAHLLAPEGE